MQETENAKHGNRGYGESQMKTTMSSRERILATCAHEPTDHVPLHLEVHPSYSKYDSDVAWWHDQLERTDDLLALGDDAMAEVWIPDPS